MSTRDHHVWEFVLMNGVTFLHLVNIYLCVWRMSSLRKCVLATKYCDITFTLMIMIIITCDHHVWDGVGFSSTFFIFIFMFIEGVLYGNEFWQLNTVTSHLLWWWSLGWCTHTRVFGTLFQNLKHARTNTWICPLSFTRSTRNAYVYVYIYVYTYFDCVQCTSLVMFVYMYYDWICMF